MKVKLRALNENDAITLYKLYLSSDLNKYTTPYWKYWGFKDFEQYIEEGKNQNGHTFPNRFQLGITTRIKGQQEKIIGTIELHKVSWVHKHAELGISIFDKELRGKGLGFLAIKELCDWAFFILNMRRIFAKAYSTNVAIIRCLEKVGFKKEGILRNHYLINNKEVDGILFGLMKNEYKTSGE